MMISTYKRLPVILFIVLLLAVIAGCHRHSPAWQRMDVAEKIMNEHPDSALVILDSINPSVLSGKEERARHALLLSMALDKNYIDTTTFDVLQPAIDYYLKKGTADQKLKTLYYQGRIYDNQGDHDKEMGCYLKAEEFMKEATDMMAMANLLVAQGTIFFITYKFPEQININLYASQLYAAIQKKDYQISCLAKALNGCLMCEDKERGDSIYNVFFKYIHQSPELKDKYKPLLWSYAVNFGNEDDIRNALRGYSLQDKIDDNLKLNLANGYNEIGDGPNAKKFFEAISDDSDIKNSLQYLAVKSFIQKDSGQLEEAFLSFNEFTDSLISRHMDIFNQDLLFAQSRHEMEMSNLRELQKKDRIIWISVCGAIVLLISACLIYYRLRLRKAELIIKEKEKREIEAELNKLKEESASLRELLSQNNEIAEPVAGALKERIELLNSMLASEITKDNRLSRNYDKLREQLMKDRQTFMDSTRLAFKASHPAFIKELEEAGLSDREINYSCLYALGLSGKEVGEFTGEARHYHISSAIGQKLGIRENNTVLRTYIRNMLKSK